MTFEEEERRKLYHDSGGNEFVERNPHAQPGVIHRRLDRDTYARTSAGERADYYVKRGLLTFIKWEGQFIVEEEPY